MKKLLFALVAVLAAFGATAQNANRTGFFVEAAIGGTVGSTPRVAAELQGTQLMAYNASGAAFNVAFGPRVRVAKQFAMDLRFVLQAPTSYVTTVPAGKIMTDVRYISKELFGNMSLYGQLGVGGAFSASYYRGIPDQLPANGEKKKFTMSDANDVAAGIAYNVAVGLNITSHFYGGLVWDGQYMFNQYQSEDKTKLNWGLMGLQVGYRF